MVLPELVPAPDGCNATSRSGPGGLPGMRRIDELPRPGCGAWPPRPGRSVAGRSDLSDQALHVFTCERSTVRFVREPHAGANAVFLTPGELQVPGEGTSVPDVPVLSKVRIEDCMPHDDPVPGFDASVTDTACFPDHPDAMRVPSASRETGRRHGLFGSELSDRIVSFASNA